MYIDIHIFYTYILHIIALSAHANRHLVQRPTTNISSGNSILNMAKSGCNNSVKHPACASKPYRSHLLGVRGKQTQGTGLTNKKGNTLFA